MNLEFVATEKPEVTRTTQENPFLEIVSKLVIGDEKSAFAFSLPSKTDEEKKALRVALRQLSEAGTELDKTVRRITEEKNGVTNVTFWAVKKIRHQKD